mgnify:CR=1 FL=1
MEDFDNAKTRNPRECVITNLNSYLTYISDIKETIKKEEGAEVSTKHYFFRGTGQQRMERHAGSVPWWDAAT